MITVIDRARCSDTADWTRVSSYSPQKILSFNLQSFLSEQRYKKIRGNWFPKDNLEYIEYECYSMCVNMCVCEVQ